jgi:hypothetical protein
MIYQTNHLLLIERLEVIGEEHVDWGAWALLNGSIKKGEGVATLCSRPLRRFVALVGACA